MRNSEPVHHSFSLGFPYILPSSHLLASTWQGNKSKQIDFKLLAPTGRNDGISQGMHIKSMSVVMIQLFHIPKTFLTNQGRRPFSYRTDVVEITFLPEHGVRSACADHLLAPGAIF